MYTVIPAEEEPETPAEETPEEPAAPVTITGNRSDNTGYRENQTFSVDTSNLPEGAEVHWFLNGEDVGTGSEYKVIGPTDDYTIQAKILDKDGNVIAEGEEQTVEVKHGFLDRIWFILAYILRIILLPYILIDSIR